MDAGERKYVPFVDWLFLSRQSPHAQERGLFILVYCLSEPCKRTSSGRGILSTSTLQRLYTSSCQFIGLRRVVCFFPPEKQCRAQSSELRLCNHCPVSASAFLCLCFLLVLELTASQWRKGFEPEGSSLYQRLIATSEQGTAPKQTFSAVKTGSAPNDVGQQGFLQQGLYGDGCQRWTNSRTLAVSSTSRSQIWPHFNGCLLVERKRLIKEETLIFCGPCVFVSQPGLTTMKHDQTGCGLHSIWYSNCSESSYLHGPPGWLIILHCHRRLAVLIANTTIHDLSTQ